MLESIFFALTDLKRITGILHVVDLFLDFSQLGADSLRPAPVCCHHLLLLGPQPSGRGGGGVKYKIRS